MASIHQPTRTLKPDRLIPELVIPKQQVRTRFLEAKDNLDQVIYSLFRSTDHGLTDELYLRIQEEGGDFSDLAHHSDGPESQTNCLVGPCPISKAHPEIAIKLKSLPIGLAKPPFWFHHWSVLLRVERRIPAKFADWRELIEQVLREEHNAEQQQPDPSRNGRQG